MSLMTMSLGIKTGFEPQLCSQVVCDGGQVPNQNLQVSKIRAIPTSQSCKE